MARVSVVIPFFQREAGILPRAVASVFAQLDVDDVHVLVIDDGSPVSAETELEPLCRKHGERITIFRQQNAGPGSARNNGLDHISEETEFVAFLDSDDQWLPEHLQTALKAMERGADFYFGDWKLPDSIQSRMESGLHLNEHKQISKEPLLYEYSRNLFEDIIDRKNVVGTSTVVIRNSKFRDVRFPEDFFNAEDISFWLQLSYRTRNLVFSPSIVATYGRGVNIAASVQWGTVKALHMNNGSVSFRRHIQSNYDLDARQFRMNRDCVIDFRKQFAFGVASCLMRGNWVPISIFWSRLKIDPMTYVYIFPYLASRLLTRIRKPD